MNGVELALVTEYMIEYMGLSLMFTYYACVTFFGAFFVYFYIKET
jgi:hypothetical protein